MSLSRELRQVGDGAGSLPTKSSANEPLRESPSEYPRDYRGKLTRWRHRNLHARVRRLRCAKIFFSAQRQNEFDPTVWEVKRFAFKK
jgi:hypothetical protein